MISCNLKDYKCWYNHKSTRPVSINQSLLECSVMILETLLRRMATRGKRPAIGLEPGTYTRSRSFSHERVLRGSVSNLVAGPFSPVAILLSSVSRNHYRALATPAYTELPTLLECTTPIGVHNVYTEPSILLHTYKYDCSTDIHHWLCPPLLTTASILTTSALISIS